MVANGHPTGKGSSEKMAANGHPTGSGSSLQAAKSGKRLPAKRSSAPPARQTKRCCGLCGATKKLTKTECCGNWICDDEDQYVIFSFARNSCYRNHHRYTLCGAHHSQGHRGRWQDCKKCRDDLEPEMYAHFGTNEYNFEVLEDPPAYLPTHCHRCQRVIVLAEGGYSYSSQGYLCGECTYEAMSAPRNTRSR